MKLKISLLLILLTHILHAQVRGIVKDVKGRTLPHVNVFEENTYNSTSTNEAGVFEMNFKTHGSHTIIFQYLGYKTVKRVVNYTGSLIDIDVMMEEENITLKEVVVDKGVNPAIEIIRNAIKNRKYNASKTEKYTCDFYSKGIFRVKNLPKKILGQKIDFFDEVIDSTRSGILYLSETFSKLTYQKPDKMKEVIVASKVSGNDNGFSFNNASSVNYDFYDNYLDFNINVVSPIADNAFNYYNYKFEGSFFTENNQQINKIKVIPKRENEPVMDGYIYIVDDSFAIYAVDANFTGNRIQSPALNTLNLKQNFSYNSQTKVWAMNMQTFDFTAGILGINISGKFTYVYSNFEFPQKFEKKTFTAEIIRFEENANKKENVYWQENRPVPLTDEEITDYLKKDALQEKKKSKQYLDSIDNKKNKFKFMDLLSGYTYNNSFEKWRFTYDGPLQNTYFNTVQGWNSKAEFSFFKRNEDKNTYWRLGTSVEYGFSDERLRPVVNFTAKLSNKSRSYLYINGGNMLAQFNRNEPISELVNTVSTLFFKDNYMKLYEKNFVSTRISKELFNGLNLNVTLEYSERKPVVNTTDYTVIKNDDLYTSNNPLLPFDFTTPAFENHSLVKLYLSTRINFGQQYITRPDGKYNLRNEKFPTLLLQYEKGFAGSENNYNFDKIAASVDYSLDLGNKGEIELRSKAGKFFNAENIAFVDFKHFNGNQTHFNRTDRYTNVFNLLPYYNLSTNDQYFETHTEYYDNGYIMNKIPLLNKLKANLVLGFHNLAIPGMSPYQEYSAGLSNLGFGKFKVLRVDYVRAYQSGFLTDGVIFGLSF